ncbi:hypothetical protein CHS0354_000872 [Potamilus streckersoni]|uniref:Uncharacterized protein n=1 Tax=Potamilus streckersoni TaxID=2493646 RepID=A0AAE0SIH2_9BIVA|nr:hypothetical protein CHS0354_000872 [Potamilus streckersoni]
MMNRSLVFMALVAIRCIQSHGSINSTEQSIQSQGSINTTEQRIKSQDYINQTERNPNLRSNKDTQIFTAGNTMCRRDNKCGYHQRQRYKWCYTDYSDNWDFCCTGECWWNQNASYMWYQSGIRWTYCGGEQIHDIQNRECLLTFPCGLHQEVTGKTQRYYWCYVDLAHNWDYCCAPDSPCEKRGYSYYWCHVVNSLYSSLWKECIPER